MQIHPRRLMRTAASAGGAFALAASLAAVSAGQDAPSGHPMHHKMAPDKTATSHGAGGGCHEMMEDHEHMVSNLDTMNATLDGLIAEMDAAGGEKRLDAMAKVIHELVPQRQRMAGMMAGTQPQMMAHMMSHMISGGAGMNAAMAECPAMKGMAAASDSSETGGHESHNH